MPSYRKSGQRRVQSRSHQIRRRAKRVAVLLSAVLLATTALLVVYAHHTGRSGGPTPVYGFRAR